MKKLLLVCAVLFAAVACSSQSVNHDGKIDRVSPSEVGMDPARLSKVDDIINASIENKEIPDLLHICKNVIRQGIRSKGRIPIAVPLMKATVSGTVSPLAPSKEARGEANAKHPKLSAAPATSSTITAVENS